MTERKRNMKARAVWYSLILSFILMVFPVISGIIVTVNNMDAPQRHWVQGAFMVASIAVPLGVLSIAKIQLSQIGFSKIKKGSMRTILYFIPIIAAKAGFFFFGFNHNMTAIVALAFFTAAIGLSEEIYFRGMILGRLVRYFSIKQAVLLSAALFAAVHASQAFSGEGIIIVMLTVVNALIFGMIASELVILTGSLIPVIIWHALYDFINWIVSVQGSLEIILIIVQSVIMITYGAYLWNKLPDKHSYASGA
ncbi:MAG: CPBP family intramembrane glutamic endopeptidase [Clostridiaceae bacterium]|nr:CPBP family intramembrane metalloprotease [Eubacteriales bacterium]